MEKRFIGIIIIFIVIIAIFGIKILKTPRPDNKDILSVEGSFGIDEIGASGSGVAAIPSASDHTTYNLEITNSEFIPKKLEIKKGDKIIFTNKGSNPTWITSSNGKNCGTSKEPTTFDTCRGLITGEKYSFTFGETGTWIYKDNLNSAKTGTIVVK